MASTVLPNGIIIPEKYSRDWYNDLYHNWQELDNLLGASGPNDGTLTIQKNGTTVGTFSANQETDETINIEVPTKTSDLNNDSGFITGVSWNDVSDKPTIPTVNNATLTIKKNGTTVDTFTANSSSDKTVNISVPTNTNELTNGAGFITADYAVPRSGTNELSGSIVPTNDNVKLGSLNNIYNAIYSRVFSSGNDTSSYMSIYSGNDSWGDGGALILYAKECKLDGMNGGEFALAAVNNLSYKRLMGAPNGTLTWEGQPVQYGSDQRLKQQISNIDDKLLDAWSDVDLVQFKYNDAVDAKKDKARLHTGYVVQQIDSACKKHGVDISQYGLYCHEEYPEETKEVEVEQADGTKTKETKVIREASEHYSLRYTEVYAVECMYLRRCIARLTARIEQLEKGNNTK